jgi:hypothetical protein
MNQLQLQFKIRDKSEELKLKISGLKTKLRSKSKFSVDKHQERENQLNNLFTKLPDTSDEFISELEKIKSSFLGKEITQEEINQIYLIKNELSNFQQEIQIQKGKPKEDENKELEIINSINNYLQVKQNFLSARQQTIEELKICLVELEKQFKKHETIGEIGNTVGNAGGAIPSAITFGIPKIIGEAIKATAKLSKISIAKQGEAEFKLSLENEEADITELNNAHISLTELLNQNSELGSQFQLNPKLFTAKYLIYDILIKDGI